MGKRKEIKFLCKDGQTREGRQDGVMFWIRKDQKREQDGLPAFYVAANDIKGKGRTIYTAGHEYFTLEGAKELCQQIMAGEANLAERKARYAAEDIEKERRAVAAATEQAKAFRDKLEATGISYHELLALEQAHEDLGDMAHNILIGYERGEGLAKCLRIAKPRRWRGETPRRCPKLPWTRRKWPLLLKPCGKPGPVS